jgi:hypothetical protein
MEDLKFRILYDEGRVSGLLLLFKLLSCFAEMCSVLFVLVNEVQQGMFNFYYSSYQLNLHITIFVI